MPFIMPQGWDQMTPQQRGVFITNRMESTDGVATEDFIIHLIKNYDVDTTARGSCGYPMLVNAARCRGPKVLETILAKSDVDINIAGDPDETAFMIAACLGKLDNMRTLVAHNADVNAQSKDLRDTALTLFLSMIRRSDLPASVTKVGTDNLLRFLLEDAKCDPNIPDSSGFTPLMMITLCKDALKVKCVLDAGADPLATREKNSDHTALTTAEMTGCAETINIVRAAQEKALEKVKAQLIVSAGEMPTGLAAPQVKMRAPQKIKFAP